MASLEYIQLLLCLIGAVYSVYPALHPTFDWEEHTSSHPSQIRVGVHNPTLLMPSPDSLETVPVSR